MKHQIGLLKSRTLELNLIDSLQLTFQVVVAWIYTSEEEEEDIALNQRKSLRDLIAKRNKGSSLKEAPKSQVPPTIPFPPPLPHTDLGLNVMKDLKKKRPVQDLEKGEVAP